jgi:EAL domain-containing protein (putative c-di-GMP-specific phosphodiesterase class I)
MRSLDKTGRDTETVVRLIVALGRQLGMKVTVEGIETPQHAAFVHQTGADFVQGFLYGPPVPAEEIASVILGSLRSFAFTSPMEAPVLRRVK